MKNISFLFLLLFISCSTQNSTDKKETQEKVSEEFYGLKKINQEGLIELSEIIAKLNKKEGLSEQTLEEGHKVKGLPCKTFGTIVDKCQMSGCWFTFKTADNKEIFVQMKEHKPTSKDWGGKTVVVEGIAYTETLSIAELRMKAKEEGASRDELSKITEPQTKYNILAEGAILKK